MRRILLLLALLLLTSCAAPTEGQSFPVRIVLEQGEGYTADRYTAEANPGDTVTFTLIPEEGYILQGADMGELVRTDTGYTLTLTARYCVALDLQVRQSDTTITYHPNGGTGESVIVPVLPTHLRLNTSTGVELFSRAGHTLTGWNTEPDGSGTAVGLGSRVVWSEGLTLYAQWGSWTEAKVFQWADNPSGVTITGYSGDEDTLVIPAELDGKPVTAIGKDACAGGSYRALILPAGLKRVEDGAFARSAVETVTLSDDIEHITDYAFTGCEALKTLHVNAVEPPVYSGNYFATFADKYDRLCALREQRKLVLFSGSSTRFGYDSAMLDEALPDYEVVNMGVFAYTSATPQLLLILDQLQPGDILLHAPEFDAAQRQFCTRSDWRDSFWCMMEANYDMAAALDLREASAVFSGFTEYLFGKAGMEPKNYDLSPADFDEDGNPVSTPSYNAYGDYILYRPNAADDAPIYGLSLDYTVRSFPKAQFLDPVNAMYQRFLDRGVGVYFTYAPRNRQALSPESTPEARASLDAWFRENLIVPVISDMEESLYPGRYLYGTDNHLSTEGVTIRTRRILADLLRQMEVEQNG